MRITRITCRIHDSAFTDPVGASGSGGNLRLRSIETLLVRVETEDGLYGWGEGFGFALAGTTRDAVERVIAPACLGEDARDIAGIAFRLRRRFHNYGRNGPVTFGLAALDIALWDLAARREGRPLHTLLGGAGRNQVSAYASLLRYGVADDVARNAAEAVRRGFRAIKLHEVDLTCIHAAREAVPFDIPLMLDVNCAWDRVDDAVAFCGAVRDMNIRWVEEPTWAPEDMDALAQVRRTAGCSIAAGENLGGVEDFDRLIRAGAVDFVQPSATKHGGISALLDIAGLARAAGLVMAPHSPYFGPGLLATLHVLAALPKAEPIEIYFVDLDAPPYGDALVPQGGGIAVPQTSGLGLEPV